MVIAYIHTIPDVVFENGVNYFYIIIYVFMSETPFLCFSPIIIFIVIDKLNRLKFT